MFFQSKDGLYGEVSLANPLGAILGLRVRWRSAGPRWVRLQFLGLTLVAGRKGSDELSQADEVRRGEDQQVPGSVLTLRSTGGAGARILAGPALASGM